MNFTYTTNDLDIFLSSIYFKEISDNSGGMGINDMFSFYFVLNTLKPKLVIESGVWNGKSTKLIRKTLGPDAIIVCLDPRDLPTDGYKDDSKNTHYLVGSAFIDFNELNLSTLHLDHVAPNDILCFFDDHQNSVQRMSQCIEKGLRHLFFNDNYPVNAGSHYSIQHLIDNDTRDKFHLNTQYSYSINTLPQIDMNRRSSLLQKIETYVVFPSIFPSDIVTYEGIFRSQGFFKDNDTDAINKYSLFYNNKHDYWWNTYLTINDSSPSSNLLSLCITTMNRWDFLKSTIPDYLENPYIDEIVISDENGNDCREIFNHFGNNPKIKLYSNERCLGVYLNKERAVRRAKNQWVALMDSDNHAPLSFFSTVSKVIDYNNPKNVYCPWRTIPQLTHEGFDFRKFLGTVITRDNISGLLTNSGIMVEILLNTGNYVFNRDFFLSVKIPFGLENHTAGLDVVARNFILLKNGVSIHIVKDMEYHHIVHSGSDWISNADTNFKQNDPIYKNLYHNRNPFIMTLRHWQTIKKPVSQMLVNTSEYEQGGHDGMMPFPIGMSYQIVNYKHLDMNQFFQHGIHNKLALLSIYPTTDNHRRPVGKNRVSILTTLASNNYHNQFEDYDIYIRKLKDYKFVFSPEGNGLDCHRHYESLMAGCIPIVENNTYIRQKYGNMPILYTDDYSEINNSYLENKYVDMLDKVYDFTPLFLDFYNKETQTQIKACSNYWCNKVLKKEYGYDS